MLVRGALLTLFWLSLALSTDTLALHYFSAFNKSSTEGARRGLLRIILENESDEVLTYFSDWKPQYRAAKARFEELCQHIDSLLQEEEQVSRRTETVATQLAISEDQTPQIIQELTRLLQQHKSTEQARSILRGEPIQVQAHLFETQKLCI